MLGSVEAIRKKVKFYHVFLLDITKNEPHLCTYIFSLRENENDRQFGLSLG